MTAARSMTIGALARDAGVNVETVRYYQRRKLLGVPTRPLGGVRRYGEDALARIEFIKRAQDLGFTLEEITALLKLERFSACRPARALAAQKLAMVEARLHDLGRLKQVLEELIARCDAGAARGCAIIESLSER
ncbi:MAG: MerR family transcriptional regulator [Burkholderiales bacterium]|nr:MerR family transcriptional regulator [Burkholderiales bacterium]